MDIPRAWRLRNQRYLLEGCVCQNCDKKYFPPVMVCGECKNRVMKPHNFDGEGTIYSFTVVYQSPVQFTAFVPYIVALVDLAEGPRITAQLTDISIEDVKIGLPVEKVIRKISEEGDRGVIIYGYKFRPSIACQL